MGSETFYSGKSPFDETQTAETKDSAQPADKPASKSHVALIVSAILVVIIAGGGFSYYWFFTKNPPASTTTQATSKTTQTKTPVTTPAVSVDPNNKNLLRLVLDTGSTKESTQATFKKMTADYLSDTSVADLVEIKVFDKNNEPISSKGLAALLGFSYPEKLSTAISDEYSLFMTKEGSQVRLGATIKLADATGLTDYLSLQEATLPENLKAFYLNQLPTGAAASFSSSLYKNADIRYFNFSSPADTSFDYSVLEGDQSSYFIFATSKEAMRSILDYMSAK
jgi:hypothetical protein